MREDGKFSFLHADHLGSTVAYTSSDTNEMRKYQAFGRNRSNTGLPTDHQFTGQKQDGTQLLYYGARYYDKHLGTFISPDPLIPDAGNVFAYNRYMYVYGSPLNYNDPSGNVACADDDAACYNAHGIYRDGADGWINHRVASFKYASQQLITDMLNEAGTEFAPDNWTRVERELVLQGIVALANKLSNFNNATGLLRLNDLLGDGPIVLKRIDGSDFFGAAAYVGYGQFRQGPGEQNRIVSFCGSAFSSDAFARGLTVHELAHVMDFNGSQGYMGLSSSFPTDPLFLPGTYVEQIQRNSPQHLATEYFAETVTIWVYEPVGTRAINPYARLRKSSSTIGANARAYLEGLR